MCLWYIKFKKWETTRYNFDLNKSKFSKNNLYNNLESKTIAVI